MTVETPPKLYLSGINIEYCASFKYLGHIISNDLSDDLDIERETRNSCIRGNVIGPKFGFLNRDIKTSLFKSYCYPLYTSSLWSKYRQNSIERLKISYNNAMRRLMGVAPWHSARTSFVNFNIRSFFENLRSISYSMLSRVLSCNNKLIETIIFSDCFVVSSLRIKWYHSLFVHNNVDLLI